MTRGGQPYRKARGTTGAARVAAPGQRRRSISEVRRGRAWLYRSPRPAAHSRALPHLRV